MKYKDELDCNFDASSKYSHRERTHNIFDCSLETDVWIVSRIDPVTRTIPFTRRRLECLLKDGKPSTEDPERFECSLDKATRTTAATADSSPCATLRVPQALGGY